MFVGFESSEMIIDKQALKGAGCRCQKERFAREFVPLSARQAAFDFSDL
jgi:hypothetical protein